MALASLIGTLLGLAGLVGLLDAGYFVGVSYGWIRSDARWIPEVCRMDEATCARIVDTSYGRVLGLPNAVYGAVWYLVVLGLGAALVSQGHIGLCRVFLLVAAGTVLFSVYLIWALVQELKVDCPLCYLGHGLNFSILILIATSCVV